MTGKSVGTTKGTTISVRRKLYEKIFSIVSEVNFKCGFIDVQMCLKYLFCIVLMMFVIIICRYVMKKDKTVSEIPEMSIRKDRISCNDE